MANARQLKRRIGSAKNISKITKAMEMVAASKMRRAQEQALATRPYTRALQASLKKVATQVDKTLHPLLQDHGHGNEMLVLVSTDKGLVGNLNNQLFKKASEWQRMHPAGKVIAVGKKAVHFCHVFDLPLHAQFTELPEKVATTDILSLTEMVKTSFLDQTFKSVDIIYMDFINTLSQTVRKVRILPMASELEVAPNFDDEKMMDFDSSAEYSFEPDAESILSKLLPYYLENSIFQAFLEARASEHSSRMVAMKNASENAGELVDELQLVFNKTRQANITNELLDITTASLTIKS